MDEILLNMLEDNDGDEDIHPHPIKCQREIGSSLFTVSVALCVVSNCQDGPAGLTDSSSDEASTCAASEDPDNFDDDDALGVKVEASSMRSESAAPVRDVRLPKRKAAGLGSTSSMHV